MNLLRPRPLDPRAFAPYGDVIEAGAAAHRYEINEGTTTRFHDLARIEPGRGGRAIGSIFRCRAGDGSPVTIRMMERPPRGSQAFGARGDQGINIAPGVWHHPLIPSAVERDFLVIDRDGEGENCDVIELSVERVLDTGP